MPPTTLLTAAASLLLACVTLADVTYQHDDGSGGNNGPGAVGTPGTYVWGNVFDADTEGGGATEITSILVAMGRIPAGATVTAMLFEDPNDDGNPDDGVLLAWARVIPTITQSNTFTQIDIPPARVAGKFYVACSAHVDGTANTYVARTDFQTGQQYGSSTFFYWGPNINPATLTGWSNRAQYTGVATVMVRAIGRTPLTPAPCAADLGAAGGVLGHDGVLDNNDFIAFIDLFFTQNSAADLGRAGGLPGVDMVFDNNDFIAFVDRFFAGCG